MSERPLGAHAGSAGRLPAGTGKPRKQIPRGLAPRPPAGAVPLPACAHGSWPPLGTAKYMAGNH
eukprot:12487730-Alexandrium_andersonii.AAC.1